MAEALTLARSPVTRIGLVGAGYAAVLGHVLVPAARAASGGSRRSLTPRTPAPARQPG